MEKNKYLHKGFFYQRGVFLCVIFLFSTAMLWTFGCMESNTITRRSDFKDPFETGTISVMTKNKTIYTLDKFHLNDSSITGSGVSLVNDSSTVFNGVISFNEIDYVQMRNLQVGKTIIAIAAVTGFGILSGKAFHSDNAFMINDITRVQYFSSGSGSGGESCPTIYSWDGSGYTLEGEGFGTSWGKALENTTGIILPHMKEKNGQYSIRITNERPETHYINNVTVVGVESDSNADVYFDPDNSVWPVYSPVSFLSAYGSNGKEISEEIRTMDGKFWESNNNGYENTLKYYDEIELTFLKPHNVSEGTIIVRSINTAFFTAVLKSMSDVIGNDVLHFVDAIEHDPEMISILQQWIHKSSCNVAVWNGTSWEEVGSILPEATEIPFTKVIHFKANDVSGDSIKLRIRTLHDVWKYDAVLIDWTPVKPLQKRPLPLNSAVTETGKNILNTIAVRDSLYMVNLPGHTIDCSVFPVYASPGKKITYAAEVGGYLYEWFPQNDEGKEFAAVNSLSGITKIKMVKEFINIPSVALPVFYSQWEKMKDIHPVKQ